MSLLNKNRSLSIDNFNLKNLRKEIREDVQSQRNSIDFQLNDLMSCCQSIDTFRKSPRIQQFNQRNQSLKSLKMSYEGMKHVNHTKQSSGSSFFRQQELKNTQSQQFQQPRQQFMGLNLKSNQVLRNSLAVSSNNNIRAKLEQKQSRINPTGINKVSSNKLSYKQQASDSIPTEPGFKNYLKPYQQPTLNKENSQNCFNKKQATKYLKIKNKGLFQRPYKHNNLYQQQPQEYFQTKQSVDASQNQQDQQFFKSLNNSLDLSVRQNSIDDNSSKQNKKAQQLSSLVDFFNHQSQNSKSLKQLQTNSNKVHQCTPDRLQEYDQEQDQEWVETNRTLKTISRSQIQNQLLFRKQSNRSIKPVLLPKQKNNFQEKRSFLENKEKREVPQLNLKQGIINQQQKSQKGSLFGRSQEIMFQTFQKENEKQDQQLLQCVSSRDNYHATRYIDPIQGQVKSNNDQVKQKRTALASHQNQTNSQSCKLLKNSHIGQSHKNKQNINLALKMSKDTLRTDKFQRQSNAEIEKEINSLKTTNLKEMGIQDLLSMDDIDKLTSKISQMDPLQFNQSFEPKYLEKLKFFSAVVLSKAGILEI